MLEADSAKCVKAGIPEDKCEHKTKLELALDMPKQTLLLVFVLAGLAEMVFMVMDVN